MSAMTTDTTPAPAAPPPGTSTDGTIVSRLPGAAERNPAAYMRRRRVTDNLLRIGVPVLLIVGWQLFSMTGAIDRRFFPAPTQIAQAGLDTIRAGDLQDATLISFRRLVLGFLLGAGSGVVVGFTLGVVRPLRVALDPVLSALYTVPKLALMPLMLLVFGLGDQPKVLLIAMSIFFLVSFPTAAAVLGLPDSYREPARSFGASRFKTFRHVLLPAVLPEIFVSLRLAAGAAVLVLVGIEMLQGGQGLGYMIWHSWQIFLAERMYVGIVTISVVGVAFQSLVTWIGRVLTPWTNTGR